LLIIYFLLSAFSAREERALYAVIKRLKRDIAPWLVNRIQCMRYYSHLRNALRDENNVARCLAGS